MINKVNGIQTNSIAFKQNQASYQPKSSLGLYANNFVNSSIRMVPSSLIFAGLWALLGARKGASFGKEFLNQAKFFGIWGVAVAAVDSFFTTRAQTKQ